MPNATEEYSIRFDASYTGTSGNYDGVTITPGAWTTFSNGQGIGFWDGIASTQTFNVNGHGGGSRNILTGSSNAGEYPGTRLMLGAQTYGTDKITVNTTNGNVYIFNYQTGHHIEYGYNLTQPAVTVGAGNLLIRNDNTCKNLTFALAFAPTISGAGSIYINDYNDDTNATATTVPSSINRPYDRGVTTFSGGATFNFAAHNGNLVIEGANVTFNNAYDYTSTTGTGNHLIAARGTCNAAGNILFNGGTAAVKKKKGNTLWIARNDIQTTTTAPVVYEVDETTQTDWRAGNNIDMHSAVTFTIGATATGNIAWYAENNIQTNFGCNANDKGAVLFKHNGTSANVLWHAVNDIHTKGRADFDYAAAATGDLTLKAEVGNIHAERPWTIVARNDANDLLITAESTLGIHPANRNLGSIYTYDSIRISRENTGAGKTEMLSRNDIRTAMVDIENTQDNAANTYRIESHSGDIELGYHSTNPSATCANPAANPINYNRNTFTYKAPGASTGWLHVYAGYQDQDANKIPWGGGNIRFTRIKETVGATSTHTTEFKIPFSNWFFCSSAGNNTLARYENAGIIGGIARCQITDTSNPCDTIGIDYKGGHGELLFDAGTRGNIIINNGAHLNFQEGTGNAKFLTRWGDIDMRYPFNTDSMKGSLLLLASSELPNKLDVRSDCDCAEPRNNVYMQDFQHRPIADGGSVFIGADNNIKMQYGGLQSGTWAQARANTLDQFFNNRPYPCNTNKVHCDADTSQNQARDLILNFNQTADGTAINSGGAAMVASDLIDVYKNMIYTGGNGSGMGAVPTYNTLHGESVAGYGLYVKTQANKNNWAMSAHDLDNDPNPTVGAACYRGDCKGQFLHNVARITFHADARLYPENQRVLIASPVLNTYGNAEYNTTLNAGSKTNILVQADSLIYHDSLIIDGPKTQFTTWSNGMERNMPVIKLGHQRFTPPAAEGAPCPDCFTHKKDPRTRAGGNNKRLDSIFVTFRNDATIDRLHSLVSDHAIISFLTDSFDHTNGKPTQNAKFYTDIFKVRNHVELFTKPDHTTDGHFELCSEEQMATKDYAGVYARHLHMEPIAPTCSDFRFSQFWFPYPMLDVIPTSTFGGFGWIHADVHVEIGANLFPGFASLGKKGNCYEQRAGVLKMQDLRLDKGSNVKVSVGEDDAQNSFAETYTCPATFEKIELGRYADCLIVDSLSVYGTQYIDVEMRSGISLEPGQTKCYPIIQYKKVGKDNLNNLKLKKLQFTEKDHKSIDGIYYLTLDIDTVCKVVYLCVATIPEPVLERRVQIPAVSGVTSTPAAPGEYMVHSRHDFRFKLKFSTPHPLKVMTGRIVDGRPEEIFGWKNANGEFEYVIRRVQQDIVLEIGPGPATKTSTDEITGAAVWATDNKLYIRVDAEDIASVYSVTGQLVKQLSIPNGTTTTLLDPGVYIITLKDGSVHKVIVK